MPREPGDGASGRGDRHAVPGAAGDEGVSGAAGDAVPGAGGDAVPGAAGDDGVSGLDLARRALSAAKAEATRRGHRPGATVWGSPAARASQDGGGGERRRRTGRAEEQRSGARPDARDPQRLDAAVHQLLADRGWQVEVSVGAVLGRWAQVMGPELAAHCTPEGFTDGELSIRADSTAWATQLRLIAPQLIGRVNDQVGPGTVSRVRVLGPAGPSWRRGPRAVKGRGPSDTYG